MRDDAVRRLAAAVLRRAVNDAAGRLAKEGAYRDYPAYHRIAEEAAAWLTTDSVGLRFWCIILDLPVEDVMEGAPGAIERTALRERALGAGRPRADDRDRRRPRKDA